MFALLFALAGAGVAAEPEEIETGKITVTGVGEVFVPPDEVVLTLGVHANAPTADVAFTAASAQMEKIVAAVGQGVAVERIRTAEVSLQPRYETKGGGAPKLIGYEASSTLEIRVDDPATVGTVLDAAVEAGANDVRGVDWRVEDESAAREAALSAAVNDARANARFVTAGLGVELGMPLQVDVRLQEQRPPIEYAVRDMAEDAGAMPVLAGEQIYRAEVTIVYALGEAAPS